MLIRIPAACAALLVAATLPFPLVAQRAPAARDSAALERQARLIARLDSQLTALRREVRAQGADSARPKASRPVPDRAPSVVDIGGLLQLWYGYGDHGFQNTFRLRRAELRLA